ncbi:MAG: bacillithiol biosynthesis deacetylase BshB1 [Planctomycetes bacterium]|nr:bacillithiol biosynthesis deacetylase BshB1 [Planctomycetota bacterium]
MIDAKPCDIVAFTAHPDDVELNCGGTLALAVRQGWKAGAVDFTRGELGTRGTPEVRAREAEEAARVLGLSCRTNLGLPDGRLRDTDEARLLVVRALRLLRPRVVIAPPLADHHPDHGAVGAILAASLHLAGIAKYAPDLEPWRPHALLHYLGMRGGPPDLVVDVTSVYETRVAAILAHASQFHREGSAERPTRIAHPHFLEAVEAAVRRSGALIGVRYGEGYTLEGPVPVADLVALFAEEPWKHPEAQARP